MGASNRLPSSLEFKAYKRDPLANFLITRFIENQRRQWPPWRLALIYVVGFLLVGSVSGLVHIANNDLALPLNGGYDGLAAWVIFVSSVGGSGSWFYIYVSRKAGGIFEEEVDSRETRGFDGLKGGDGEPPHLARLLISQRRRDDQFGGVVYVLRCIAVELRSRLDLSRHRGLRLVVP